MKCPASARLGGSAASGIASGHVQHKDRVLALLNETAIGKRTDREALLPLAICAIRLHSVCSAHALCI